MKRFLVFLLFFGLLSDLLAQEPLTRSGSYSLRKNEIMALPENPERIRTLQRARELGIPVRRTYPDGRIVAIRRISPNGMPEYLTTSNLNAARTLSSNRVWKDGGAGLDLSGEGLVVGVWDAGILRTSHYEFEDRGRPMNADAEELGHPTHVSGTIAALGIDGDARGMANKAIIEAYDWDNDLEEMEVAASEGLLLSNHSYGYILGFDYNSEESRWQWWGDTEISEEEEYLFGYYHGEARAYDRLAFEYPNYLIVKSAGNDRGEGPQPGSEHYVWDNGDWVPSTATRQIDGGEDGFGSIGPVAAAKNILAVGAVRDLPDGVTDRDEVEITGFSVFGPTDDGRIKPDIVANGQALYSTYSGNDSAYRSLSGTSMSAPNTTGSLALLQEHNHNVHATYLNAASLKGLVLHTASDAGNPGPDYSHGWGVMNTAEAAKVIGDTSRQRISEQILSDLDTIKFSFYCDGTQELKATLCWIDPAGDVPAPSLNPTDQILVNDLDIRVIRKIDNRGFRPFILDPLSPSQPATTGDNNLDNVEQVLIKAPDKGFYEIEVKHKGELQGGKQPFSLIISGLSDDFYASGIYHLTDNNGVFILTSASEYKPEMEAGWLLTPENGLPVSLAFNFLETEENRDLVRIYDGGDSSAHLLAEFSGTLLNTDTLLRASGDSMWLSFSSDQQNQGRGFEATYCTTPPEGDFMIEGLSFPCAGSEESYLARGQEGSQFQWIPPEGWELKFHDGNYAKFLVGPERGLLELLPYNSCGESSKTYAELEPLFSPAHIENFTGDTLFCSGESGVLKVDSLPGSVYQWMLPVNWMGRSESHEISFITSSVQGDVLVSAYNSCGQGDTLGIPTLVMTYPPESQIYSVSDKICQNAPNVFYIFPEEDVDYQWSVDPTWIISGSSTGDSVDVAVGANTSTLYVSARNECGARNSQRSFLLTPGPDKPLLMETGSVYDGLREIEVQNASSYTLIQWYLNGLIIDSPLATGPSYVAYVPGTYSVGVTNRDACSLIQNPDNGINTVNPGNLFSVNAGTKGALVVQNASEVPATLKLYDLAGELLLIFELDPGRSEIQTGLQGVQLVSVEGSGNIQVFRIFLN